MIDIHTHILPGLDDGAQTWEDALNMARAAVAEGITTVIATPHHANGVYLNKAEAVRAQAELFRERLAAEGIPLKVECGQEIRVHDDLLDAWQRNELLTLAGSSYMLIEMPSGRIPSGMRDLIHELKILGLKPIIAHPERNAEAIRHPERLSELLDAGAYAQVTTHSLLGLFGKKIEDAAWSFCKNGLVHLVSSDAHHADLRGFRLREAYDRISSKLGEKFKENFRQNAEDLLYNHTIRLMDHSRDRISLWKKIERFIRKS